MELQRVGLVGFLELWCQCVVSDEVRREAQGAFHVVPGKSGLHAHGKGERCGRYPGVSVPLSVVPSEMGQIRTAVATWTLPVLPTAALGWGLSGRLHSLSLPWEDPCWVVGLGEGLPKKGFRFSAWRARKTSRVLL